MFQNMAIWLRIVLSFAVALIVSHFMTPPVKTFAERVGAIDVPRDGRRVHDHPIPRMGGLAIFIGFVVAMILFVSFTTQVLGLLLGALIIAVMGAVDDIVNLRPWIKLSIQIIAALVAIRCGIIFTAVSNPNFMSDIGTIPIGSLAIPLTVLWIVGCTNAVNLIDGLDGLACGVSAISSMTMMIVSLFVADPNTTFILAALCGACVGFIPYNLNPAKIFMGDTGALFLGYTMSVLSILGCFKFNAIVSLWVPFLIFALPIVDTAFAFTRRILHGQSPFTADRGHLHHRLIDRGFDQKHAVLILYAVSGISGISAILISIGNFYGGLAVIAVALVILYLNMLYSSEKKENDPAAAKNTETNNK